MERASGRAALAVCSAAAVLGIQGPAAAGRVPVPIQLEPDHVDRAFIVVDHLRGGLLTFPGDGSPEDASERSEAREILLLARAAVGEGLVLESVRHHARAGARLDRIRLRIQGNGDASALGLFDFQVRCVFGSDMGLISLLPTLLEGGPEPPSPRVEADLARIRDLMTRGLAAFSTGDGPEAPVPSAAKGFRLMKRAARLAHRYCDWVPPPAAEWGVCLPKSVVPSPTLPDYR